MKRVAVFCGANRGANDGYEETARKLGTALAGHGRGIVYGGGGTGMMGALSRAAMTAGGEVIGVIPESLVRAEVANKSITELRVTPTMHERKAMMYGLADGFIVLPGGIGTMDELFETLVWLHLGYHRKPVGLLNVGGFFDGLVTFLEHMRSEGFLRAAVRDLVLIESSMDTLIERMLAFKAPELPAFLR